MINSLKVFKNDYQFILKTRTGHHSEGYAIAFKKSKFILNEFIV